jgi:hypothetical protein
MAIVSMVLIQLHCPLPVWIGDCHGYNVGFLLQIGLALVSLRRIEPEKLELGFNQQPESITRHYWSEIVHRILFHFVYIVGIHILSTFHLQDGIKVMLIHEELSKCPNGQIAKQVDDVGSVRFDVVQRRSVSINGLEDGLLCQQDDVFWNQIINNRFVLSISITAHR